MQITELLGLQRRLLFLEFKEDTHYYLGKAILGLAENMKGYCLGSIEIFGLGYLSYYVKSSI